MQSFVPQKILLEASVASHPLSRRVLQKFPQVSVVEVESYADYKEPAPITSAKKILALVEHRGQALKPFPKIKHALNLGDYVFNPVSNCHLECTYCILQSYLQNNPVLTVFANLEKFFEEIRQLCSSQPDRRWRLGTGELSDSLALDPLTGLSRELIPFFSSLPNAFLELKTKSDCIDQVLDLEHGGRTVCSWSLAPQEIILREELKCADLSSRLQSAKQVQEKGYPVGLHLDPLIYFAGWEQAYRDLIAEIAGTLDPRHIAWVSLGSLRFDKGLKEVATARFPQTAIFAEDFVEAPDGKQRYFKNLRREMYRKVWLWLMEWSNDFPRYLCMEPPWMWGEATGERAPGAEAMEARLTQRLESLRR